VAVETGAGSGEGVRGVAVGEASGPACGRSGTVSGLVNRLGLGTAWWWEGSVASARVRGCAVVCAAHWGWAVV